MIYICNKIGSGKKAYIINQGFELIPLTEIKSFRRLNDDIKTKLIDNISEWRQEMDPENFLDDFIRHNKKFNLDYVISNFIFRYCINSDTILPSIIKEIKDIIISDTDIKENYLEVLTSIFRSFYFSLIKIIKIFPKLISLSHYFKITRQSLPEYIYLYRGFSKGTNIEILRTDRVDSISVNAILSTSINFNVARKFCGNEGTIWRILIHKSSFEKFKYSYISSERMTINEQNMSKDSPETEFLLNYGIILKHMTTEEIDEGADGFKYTLQTYLFLDYDISQLFSNFDICFNPKKLDDILKLIVSRDYLKDI